MYTSEFKKKKDMEIGKYHERRMEDNYDKSHAVSKNI